MAESAMKMSSEHAPDRQQQQPHQRHPKSPEVKGIDGMKLVKDTYDFVSPNLLEDNEIYLKVGKNSFFEISPPVVHIQFCEVGKLIKKTVRITNVSPKAQRLHVLLPSPKSEFKVSFPQNQKMGTMAPGSTQLLHVSFTPKDFSYSKGEVKVHAASNLLIPMHAYPAIGEVNIPKVIDMGNTLIGETVEKSFTIENRVPVSFEFKLSKLDYNQAFTATPMSGLIEAKSRATITIKYTALRMCTTRMRIKLEVSQFGFAPIVSTVIGSCTHVSSEGDARLPCVTAEDVAEHQRQEAGRSPKFSSAAQQGLKRMHSSSDLDDQPTKVQLQSQGQIDSKVRRMSSVLYSPMREQHRKPKKRPEDDRLHGVRIPDRFNQNSVNTILLHQPGKMTINEMKQAIKKSQEQSVKQKEAVEKQITDKAKSQSVEDTSHPTDYSNQPDDDVVFQGGTEQMKEMVFLRKLNDYRLHEKRLAINPTKERIGQKLLTDDQRKQIMAKWKQDNKDSARRKRDEERKQTKHTLHATSHKRVIYPIEMNKDTLNFRKIQQDDWESRKFALKSFIDTATTILIRKRVDSRIAKLKSFIESRTDDDFGDAKLPFELGMSKKTIMPVAFPDVERKVTDRKEQAVEDIPEVFPIRSFKLKQPSTYKLLDYKHMDLPSLPLYMAPHNERALRAGALEEYPLIAPSGMAPGKLGSLDPNRVRNSVLKSYRKFGRAVEENALLAYSKPADNFKKQPEAVKEEEHEHEAKEDLSSDATPEHLLKGTAWTYPGTKEWPYLLLRSHPSLYVHSPMIPQSEVEPAEYALRPEPVGDVKKHKYYLYEENGHESLVSLRQLPMVSQKLKRFHSSSLEFKFADIVPLQHPHVDLDEEIPIQKSLAEEDVLSDSDSDDDETSYKPIIPTRELCRNMFFETEGDTEEVEAEPNVDKALREARVAVNTEMDETRLVELAKLPVQINKLNRMTVDKNLRIANFFS